MEDTEPNRCSTLMNLGSIGNECRPELSSPKMKMSYGFKESKDKVILLFCGNAERDCKIKPLLISQSENLRVLKGYLKFSPRLLEKQP
jgi:hypothetical protein